MNNTMVLLIIALVAALIATAAFMIATGLTVGQLLTLLWDWVTVPSDPNGQRAVEWRDRRR